MMKFTLALMFYVLLLICTLITGSGAPLTDPLTEDSEQETFLSGLVVRMEKVDAAMDTMIAHVAKIPDLTKDEFESILEVYVQMMAYLKLAEIGDLEMFLIYEILDDAMGRLLTIFHSHNLSPDGLNLLTLSPRTFNSDKDIGPIMVQRSNWMLHQISSSKVSEEFRILARHICFVQAFIISELKSPPAVYEDSTFEKRNILLETVWKVISTIYEAKGSWMRAFDHVMENYFQYLHHVYFKGSFPRGVPSDLVVCLAKLGIVFESDECNLQLALMTREHIFRTQSTKVETVLDYMKERRSTAKIHNVDTRPFAHLSPSLFGVQQLISFSKIVELDLEAYWPTIANDEEKKQMALFEIGIMVTENMLFSFQETIISCSKHAPGTAAQMQIMDFLSSLITTSNTVLLEGTNPIISPAFQSSVRTVLETPRDYMNLKSVKAMSLEAAYSVVEAELALLHKTNPEKAIMLYHYLGLCRGIVALWINIVVTSKKELSGQEKEKMEGSLMIPMSCNNSLIIYYESRDFLACFLSIYSLENLEFALLKTQVTKVFNSFGQLFFNQTLAKDCVMEFYLFVEKRIQDNMEHPLFKPLYPKIKRALRKALKPRKNPGKTEKKTAQSTNRPIKSNSSQTNSLKVADKPEPEISCIAKVQREEKATEGDVISTKEESSFDESTSKAIIVVPSKPNKSKLKNEALNPIRLVKPLSHTVVHGAPQILKQENVWANAVQRLVPTFGEQLMRSQIKQAKPKAISNRIIEKYEEPTHHAATAVSLGFVLGNIDPRDYLMALILIGERLVKRKFEPMLVKFQSKQSTNYLCEMFHKSIDSFEKELWILNQFDPDLLKPALKQAGLNSVVDLVSCIKYYKLRIAVCHPYTPKSAVFKKNIIARHLTTLDVLQSYDPSMLLRMRHHLECYDEVFVRSIETEADRPNVLYSPQYTDKVLTIIGLFEIIPLEDIRMDRNEVAHKNTTDAKYSAYVKYVFGNSPDYEFLAKI